jgi:carboxyl-terminal processing protease
MNINRLSLVIISSLLLIASCKKDPVAPAVTMTPALGRDSLYSIMRSWYYWYDLMPSVNKNDYDDPYTLLEAMRYKELDRWSFVADYEEFKAQMEGSFVGHGFRIGLDDNDTARIVLIYSNSPLFAQGVRRGWIVKKINGTDVAPVLKSHDDAAYSNLIGASEVGIMNIFTFKKPDGTEVTIPSTKSEFTLNSVIVADTLHLSSGITGHLVFDAFIIPSEDELYDAFAYFSAQGVTDLILDLRYNSGGYLYIAQELASYIAGNALKGSDFVKLLYNNKHTDQNRSFPLLTTSYPLTLPRLVVITTYETASASECIMNGLKPYINIISIGDTTNGKPAGMDGGEIGKKYFVAPVTFKLVNKDDQGEYFGGLIPDVLAEDDITHNFNDREELCLKTAISYLETGSLTTKGISVFKRKPQFSEKPAWMKNGFVIAK